MAIFKKQSGLSLTSVLVAAEAQSARIIGITSERAGSGVSLAAEGLAKAYANFGRRTLLLEVEHAPSSPEGAAPTSAVKNRRASGRTSLDVASVASLSMETDPHVYRRIYDSAGQDYKVIIVDLPPVAASTTRSPGELLAPVAACDLVFLVGLTGEADRDSVGACVEMCRIGGVKLGGLILNDWKMPASRLLMLERRKKTASTEPTPDYDTM